MSYPELSSVLRFFEEISQIPRISGNEKGVSAYLSDFAKTRGLDCTIDSAGNVLIKKNAQNSGSDNAVILQGHMDMVGEKISSSDHDFTKDPIKLVYDGDILRADGTTLGADNGIGMSIILAILDSDKLSHPPLECVFTVEEEIGLNGAAAFDFAALSGRKYLNLDSEGEGVATVACAGGVRCDIEIPLSAESANIAGNDIKISVDGLAGGHSGEDINKRRTNACLLLAELISSAADAVRDGGFSAELVAFNGGSKDNAIPRSASAIVRCDDPDTFLSRLSDAADDRTQYLCDEDMLCRLSVSAVPASGKVIGNELLSLLKALPCGVIEMEPEMPDFVRTSANIGVVSANDKGITVTLSGRSSDDSSLDRVITDIAAVAESYGGTSTSRNRYPGWARRNESDVRPVYNEAVRNVLGRNAEFCSIHAGLECGTVSKKVPDMDMISIGPVIKNMHSPEETVSLPSVERFIRIVCMMLENM